jgi:hypothetical protein
MGRSDTFEGIDNHRRPLFRCCTSVSSYQPKAPHNDQRSTLSTLNIKTTTPQITYAASRRHGHLPEREIMTGIGPVGVRCPRVPRDVKIGIVRITGAVPS